MQNNTEEKPNYYAILPANIRYDNRLNANEKLLYGEITALTHKTGECWASNKYFSELYNKTPQAISKWILNLKKCGYLDIDYIYNGKEIEKRVIRVSMCVDRGINVCLGRYQQEIKENNTSINNINYKYIYSRVIEYLNKKIGTSYKSTTKSTQSHIKARLDEGFTEEDFIKVIDTKVKDWKNTKLEKFLRPDTLFSTKFESYLNQKENREEEWWKKYES